MIKNENYSIEKSTGILKQKNVKETVQYNEGYVNDRYNSYGELGKRMSFLRLGFLEGVINKKPNSICDVGYGNGDFLYVCKEYGIKDLTGVDVSGYKLTEDIKQVETIPLDKHFDVITFFDSLEHFQSLDFLKDVKASYIFISYPECHFYQYLKEFMNWKHRRENEHIYHFNRASIINLFGKLGYSIIASSDIEDTIRKPYHKELNNITSVVFEKRK